MSLLKLVDGNGNERVIDHNIGDKSIINKVVYSGSTLADAYLAMVKLLKGVDHEIRTTTALTESLAGVDTVAELETYVTTNLADINAKATLMGRE